MFENFTLQFLKTQHPYYSKEFVDVVRWNDFVSEQDTGIDLIGITHDGEYYAIQCKFYAETTTISKNDINAFITTSNRSDLISKNNQPFTINHRLLVHTTYEGLSTNAVKVAKGVQIIGRDKFEELDIDYLGYPDSFRLPRQPLTLRKHQQQALQLSLEYFQHHRRGSLIMACGTGKTLTSLRIAEALTANSSNKLVVYLVPSLALIEQTLESWSANSVEHLQSLIFCSDEKSKSRSDELSMTAEQLSIPHNNLDIETKLKRASGMTVVFSTYQSLPKLKEKLELVKQHPYLTICDEAHRTTGASDKDKDSAAFQMVHDDSKFFSQLRLYMTATPRIYLDRGKLDKNNQEKYDVYSMDDTNIYGEQFYNISFADAIKQNLLCDYQVRVIKVESSVSGDEDELTDEQSKIKAFINAIDRGNTSNNQDKDGNIAQINSILAFSQKIEISKSVRDIVNELNTQAPETNKYKRNYSAGHVEGKSSKSVRGEELSKLRNISGNNVHILSNVRCLSEGVDIDSLDGVIFLSKRSSVIDIIQAVGRVMRKSKGKDVGYIFIPVLVHPGENAQAVLNNSDEWNILWNVIRALKSHDEGLAAAIDSKNLEYLQRKIAIMESSTAKNTNPGEKTGKEPSAIIDTLFDLPEALCTHIVNTQGDRRYLERWASNLAEIAERQTNLINNKLLQEPQFSGKFEELLHTFQENINPTISQQQLVEMLAQHMLSKPIFDALFSQHSNFIKQNAISQKLNQLVEEARKNLEPKDLAALEKLETQIYDKLTNYNPSSQARRELITEIYDQFFRTAIPKTVKQLGIVYSPCEAVNFMLNSVDDLLQQEFGARMRDRGVKILEPFAGTGTFIANLIGDDKLIPLEYLQDKITHDIFAVEILLLAYYIANANIDLAIQQRYQQASTHQNSAQSNPPEEPPIFKKIALSDTFQLFEENNHLFSGLGESSDTANEIKKQKDIQVIIGNPPYSQGQTSANNNASNFRYPKIEARNNDTYGREAGKVTKNAIQDSYVKAFRLASDGIINSEKGGIVAFVTNGGWLESKAGKGIRKTFAKEFSKIYVYNLKGNFRKFGEESKKEGGNIFGNTCGTTVVITFLIRHKDFIPNREAEIYYRDIGDYFTTEKKKKILEQERSIINSNAQRLIPNHQGDWLNQRTDFPDDWILTRKDKENLNQLAVFTDYKNGITSNRDRWVYNFDQHKLLRNITNMVEVYHENTNQYIKADSLEEYKTSVNTDKTKIGWCGKLFERGFKDTVIEINPDNIVRATYRPFVDQWLYYDKLIINTTANFHQYLPPNRENLFITISTSGEFSALIVDKYMDYNSIPPCKILPLKLYAQDEGELLTGREWKYAINEEILIRYREAHGINTTEEDIFYYTYAIFHHYDYLNRFEHTLDKEIPKIPVLTNSVTFFALAKKGRELAQLHLNYQQQPRLPELDIVGEETDNFYIQKAIFSKQQPNTIIYNAYIKINNIPEKAFDYKINGTSVLKQLLNHYQIKHDKDSDITNNPNDYAHEIGDKKFIFNLFLSVITVSVKTVEIMEQISMLDLEISD